MQPAEYSQLRAFEGWYWWFAAQRMNLATAMRELKLPRGARVLDAGCGSGATLEGLTRELGLCGHGMDVSGHAASLWKESRSSLHCRGSVNSLPYADRSFDAVFSVDVLGSTGVEREAAVGEISRVLRPGGVVVLLVPAYQWMLSAHDAAVHSARRFTRTELADLVERAGLKVVRVTHRFPFFFPAIATVRMARKFMLNAQTRLASRPSSARLATVPAAAQPVSSDLWPIPKWLNRLLLTAARWEHAVVGGWNVPFGSTILLAARKVGP